MESRVPTSHEKYRIDSSRGDGQDDIGLIGRSSAIPANLDDGKNQGESRRR